MTEPTKSVSDETGKLDLDQLKDLDFGPNWSDRSPAKPASPKSNQERTARKSGPPRDRRPARKRTSPGAAAREEFFEPVVQFSIYPEDEPFELLTQSIRSSLKVYELFEVTRLILDKADRMVVVVSPLSEKDPPLYECLGDHQLFREEGKALHHAATQALPAYFTEQEEEVEAPSGNFSSVMRCGVTGRYLPPKNYHRFQALLAEHHRLHCPDKPISRIEKSLESVQEPEAVQEWLDSMKKRTVYRLRPASEEKPAEAEPESPESEEDASPAAETEAAGMKTDEAPATEPESTQVFQTREDALQYILMNQRKGLVRETRQARVPGKTLLEGKDDSIRKSFHAYLEKQKKFPLETANNVRMKLRKGKFFLFKKGKKGISYVAAVRRKNREPDAVFTESAQAIIQKIEENPALKIRDLPSLLYPDREAVEGKVPLADEEKRKLINDLKWLKLEGYLYEFSDGSLEIQPLAPAAEKAVPPNAASGAGTESAPGETSDADESSANG